MKGLTHFVSGVAAASFVKAAVTGDAGEGSFALLLAGVGGILPDTLDFKVAQFVEAKHFEVDPDPKRPDPEAIARTVVEAVEKAWNEPGEWSLHFHTARLSGDLWRQYFVNFDPKAQAVTVRIGPAVTMGQTPIETGDGQAGKRATLPLPRPIQHTYDEETAVDIFNGPSFGFRKTRDGSAVEVVFLPWHRRWSHSLTGGALFGLVVTLLLGPLYGLCAGLGWFAHVLEDQLGHMGSNLFFPFTRRRMTGLKLMRSGDALPNFFFVWLSLALIFWNLNRFHPRPPLDPSFLTGFLPYIAAVLVVPFALLWVSGKLIRGAEERREKACARAPGTEAGAEMGDEFAG